MTDWSDCLTEGGRALASVASQSRTTLIAVHSCGVCKGKGTRGRELIYGNPPHGEAVTVADTAACPVCACRKTNGDYCARPLCGWLMTEKEEWGKWTDWDLKTFNETLDHERHRWDARAALRASTDGSDSPIQWIRAGQLTPAESRTLAAEVAKETPPRHGPAERALERLVEKNLRAVVFIVVDPQGISRYLVETDGIGTPKVEDRRPPIRWSDHVPELLRKAPDHRRFLLAGGHGTEPLDWSALQGSLERTNLRQWGKVDASETIVLWRMVGWPVAALAVQEVRGEVSAFSEQLVAGGAGDPVDKLLRQAPLRHSYGLAYAEVDPITGDVLPAKVFPLFTRDARAGAEVTVTITPPRLAPNQLLLPVVVIPSAESSDWRSVRVGKLRLPGEGPVTVTVRLDRPGHVTFTSPAGITSDDIRWYEIEAGIPARADGRPVDLVCAVELGGDKTALDQRIGITRRIITNVKDRYIGNTALQVGLLGYGDHDDDADFLNADNPVSEHPLGPPVTALDELRRWSPRAYRNDLGAPLEDALKALSGIEWREGSHRVLLIVASRPPHPPTQEAFPGRNVCPRGLDWSALLIEVKDVYKLTCVVLRQPLKPFGSKEATVEHTLDQRAKDMWQALGYTGPFDDAKLEEQVWAAAGVASGGTGTLQIPIDVRPATA